MNKKTVFTLVIIVLIFLGLILYKQGAKVDMPEVSVAEENATSTIQAEKDVVYSTATTSSKLVTIVGGTVPEKAWNVFEQYVAYAKNHDISGIKSIAHKVSSTCSDISTKEKEAKCFAKLDGIHSVTKDLKEINFSHSYFDNKQVVLFTDSSEAEFNGDRISSRQLLYFTIDSSGSIKTLGLDLGRVFIVKIAGKSKEEVDNELAEKLKDIDQDTEEDVIETCGIKDVSKTCVETNEKKRDTDGDGYWDSLEKFI